MIEGQDIEPVFVIGYPGPVGGACTELWHVLKLWRRFGLEVHLVPTWTTPEASWRQRCDSLGCQTHIANPNRDELEAIPGLAGGFVVSFCNENFLVNADLFRDLGCRIAWVGCMNWLFPRELEHYARRGPFDAYACQSAHQHRTLAPQLARWGVAAGQVHRLRGAFDPDEFAFNPLPHGRGEPFVIGRISRAAPDKFSTNTWSILGRANYPVKRARVLGWADPVAEAIGPPPPWAEVLPPGAEPAEQFLAGLHCYCQLNGKANENWPRAGLEAMAAGVPIVVEDRGGWREMIDHGRTGFVCRHDLEISHWLAHLAWDEDARLEVAAAAYRHLIKRLAEPERIWDAWVSLFRATARADRKESNGKAAGPTPAIMTTAPA